MSVDHLAHAINAAINGAPSLKLTLVVLANHMNRKTGLCNPSLAKVALQVGLSEKQTRILLHKLKNDGYISVAKNAFGGSPGSTPHYKIHLEKLKSKPILQIKGGAPTPPTNFSPTPLVSLSRTAPIEFQDHSRMSVQTPPLDETQTMNKPYINPSIAELESKHGKYWHEDPYVVRPLGALLKQTPLANESICDFGAKLKALLQ